MEKQAKQYLIVGIISLVLLTSLVILVMAAPSLSDKSYDEETKTITIKDTADIKLNTPIIHKVIRGKDRLVAEFTVDNKEDYANVIDNLIFYNIKDGMKEFTRTYEYKYKVQTGTRKKSIYNFTYIEHTDYENYTKAQTSLIPNPNNVIGYEDVPIYEWVPLEKAQESMLKDESITIGIFTDVNPGDHVEWIITLYGVELTEWAEWTEALDAGLVAYYKMDGETGTIVDYIESYDGTNAGCDQGQDGILGLGIEYVAANTDYWTADIEAIDNTQGFTLSFWFNFDTTVGDPAFYYRDDAKYAQVYLTKPYFQIGGLILNPADIYISDGDWNMITYVSNASDFCVFVNGTAESACAGSGGADLDEASDDFGAYRRTWNWPDGNMDELGVWDRSLTWDEIDQLYNEGTGITPSAVGPCDCPGEGEDWEVDMEELCYISDACSCKDITFINTGNFTCDAAITATSVEGLAVDQRGYVTANCVGVIG